MEEPSLAKLGSPSDEATERQLRMYFGPALFASAVVVAVFLLWAGIKIEIEATSTAILRGVAVLAIVIRSIFRDTRIRAHRVLRNGAEYFGYFVLICVLAVLASYPAAAESSGFADPSLERVDRLMRFDWVSWYAWVSVHPALQFAGRLAYASIFVTPVILLGYFAYAERRRDATQFLISFWLAAILTLAIFTQLPAIGPLAFLWHGPIPYMPTSALYHVYLIEALRQHQIHWIALGDLHGLVCTPSFHTASAVLFIAFAWRIPALRWQLIGVNVAMILATPVEGTHYLVDMLVGAGVACFSLLLTSAMLQLGSDLPAEPLHA